MFSKELHDAVFIFQLALTVGTVFGLAAISLIVTGYELMTKRKVR